jgi:catabolite regulation protein CreA
MCCWVDTQRSKEIKKKNKMKDDRQVEMICINSGTKKSLKYMKREKKKIFPSSSSFLHNQLLVKRLRGDCGRTAAVTECASIAHGSTW